ncbi:MAG: hypothetical protein LBB76_05600 [Azoarcus sp.]|nr:hypothetical protein [Azoarcus sp.]
MPVISDTPAFVPTAKADARIKSDVWAIGFCYVAGYTASEGEPDGLVPFVKNFPASARIFLPESITASLPGPD